jgi:hypothetical protein
MVGSYIKKDIYQDWSVKSHTCILTKLGQKRKSRIGGLSGFSFKATGLFAPPLHPCHNIATAHSGSSSHKDHGNLLGPSPSIVIISIFLEFSKDYSDSVVIQWAKILG